MRNPTQTLQGHGLNGLDGVEIEKKTFRFIDMPIGSRPIFNDLEHFLKEGKVGEFIVEKEKRLNEWKKNRYRICVECAKKKLRIMFNGDSKRCKFCHTHRKRQSKQLRREYHKEYIRKGGLQNWCSKQIVYYLKKMGLLIQQPCQECKEEKSYAHHCDYNKPWEVMWLCNKHHKVWHKNNEPRYITN